ncbi:hypothetical protein D8S82_02280 [Mycobacterium hodleri]|uniref:Uncharacterized protein n=1 Tax=Mycolicibacterium hodleri TaxID=49897 RepID=A0A544W866_9MYCO|nr:hypothetical protein D8S82_02280 [Mycolicibacterium hodleri]
MLSFEWGDIQKLAKIVTNVVNPLTGERTLKLVPYENSIQPVPLNFEPPLIEHAVGEKHGFRHHWELLTYAFSLPDPAAFPVLPELTADDRRVLKRYSQMCRQLAGYSALNEESGMYFSHKHGGEPEITLKFPSPEAFGGTSVAFRQLHSGEDSASFDRAKGRLMKAVKLLPAAEQDKATKLVAQWAKARGALINRMLQTIVCEMVAPPVPPDREVPPFSYANINPQKLILTFNYGDTIHFSEDEEANLSTLLETEQNACYYKHSVLSAITNLSHLYFGFALLAEAAMGPSV